MRIISGSARGRRLLGPPGKTTRPMTDRMRESLFSSIASWIPGSDVMDLFAGAGTLGLEALSRGAGAVTFVEQDRNAVIVLRRNIEAVGLGGTVISGDVDSFLERSRSNCDLAFVDPPYAVALPSLVETVGRLAPLVTQDGLVIVHRRSGEEPPAEIGSLALVAERTYGSGVLWRYQKERT
jgi:16S rRNA (guanine966-N2)-methyltransferase